MITVPGSGGRRYRSRRSANSRLGAFTTHRNARTPAFNRTRSSSQAEYRRSHANTGARSLSPRNAPIGRFTA